MLATAGNLNNEIGVPLTLLALHPALRYAVIEMGAAKPGDIRYLGALVRPDVAVLTNALPAHLQGFGSLQAVAATKGEIYDALGPDGVAVLNVDEPFADAWLARIGARTVLRASARGAVNADVRAEDVMMHEGNASFRLVSAAGAVRIALGVPGVQQVANAVCAAAAAMALGLGLEAIRDGLESLAPVSGRMQRRAGARGCVLIDDSYNANPGSVRAAIDSLATFGGTRVLVLGNMAELGAQSRELHREVGAHARARGIERAVGLRPACRRGGRGLRSGRDGAGLARGGGRGLPRIRSRGQRDPGQGFAFGRHGSRGGGAGGRGTRRRRDGEALMLLLLADWLSEYFKVFKVFQYLTFRGILGVLTALAITLLVGPAMIRRLNRYQIGQSVRSDGPQSHLSKAGTPTMGGALILVGIVTSTLLWGDLGNRYVWVVLAVTVAFGAVGWIDDYRKVVEKDSRGLPARWKYFWQSVAGLGAAIYLYASAASPAETQLIVPFFKQVTLALGPLFVVLAYFVIVGASNAVNLTDGLDGLAIMPSVLVAGALAVIAYLAGHSEFAPYLHIPYIAGAGELVVFCGALAGAGLGFLWFNTYPGDGVHGRRRRAGARRRAGRHRGDRAPRDRVFHHGRGVRDGDGLGDAAGRLVQADGPAHLPHGADPPPFRAQGMAGAARDRALLDHHGRAGPVRTGHVEVALSGAAQAMGNTGGEARRVVVGMGQTGLSCARFLAGRGRALRRGRQPRRAAAAGAVSRRVPAGANCAPAPSMPRSSPRPTS